MPDAPEWQATVLAARELAGLSRDALARRMDASWDTVRKLEQGGDARLSTLQALLGALPFLGPGALLGGDPHAPPLASPAAWRTLVDLHGFLAERVRLTARIEPSAPRQLTLEIAGVRPLAGSLRDEALRTNLLRAVVPGPASFVRELVALPSDLRGTPREMTAGEALHSFTFPRDLDRAGFSHARRWQRARLAPEPALMGEAGAAARGAEALAHDVTIPTRTLELVLEVPRATRCPPVALFVAPDTAVPPMGAFALSRAHLPAGAPARWDARRRRLVVTIERPLLAVRYGLAFLPDEEGDEPSEAPFARPVRPGAFALGGALSGQPPSTVAERLRTSRERAGLSRRQLALRMSVSVASVIEAESGRDPRRSTLLRVLQALPDMRPGDLFGELGGDEPLSPAAAWAYQASFFGASADVVARTVTLRRTGSAAEQIETRGLRRLHAGAGPLVVKDGIALARHGRAGPVFLSGGGASRASELRVRWRHDPGIPDEFYLALPEEQLEAGASYARRERKERAYKMRADETARSIGPAFECVVPARRLVLEVRFPRGWWPPEVAASARAAVTVTNPRWPDLRDRAHAGGHSLVLDPHAGTARLTIERPLIGLRYSIRWRAP